MRGLRAAALLFSLCACGGDGEPAAPDAAGPGAPDATPFSAETIHFSTGDWMVPPGSEPTRCLFTKLESDTDFLVVGYRATMLEGSHHFNMFWIDPDSPGADDHPLDQLTGCNYGFASYLAGSQWQEIDQVIPNGLAVRIPANSILVLESHYVNTSEEPMPARVDVEFDRGDPADITNVLGLYFNIMEEIQIEAGQRVRLRGRCPTSAGSKLVLLTSHTHWHSEGFEINLIDAEGGSRQIYLSEDYAHPETLTMWDDPIVIGEDEELEWACNYYNPTDTPVYSGGRAEADEMCIMAAFYWPEPAGGGGQPYCLDDATPDPAP